MIRHGSEVDEQPTDSSAVLGSQLVQAVVSDGSIIMSVQVLLTTSSFMESRLPKVKSFCETDNELLLSFMLFVWAQEQENKLCALQERSSRQAKEVPGT